MGNFDVLDDEHAKLNTVYLNEEEKTDLQIGLYQFIT